LRVWLAGWVIPKAEGRIRASSFILQPSGRGLGHEPSRLRVRMGHARTTHRTLPRLHQVSKDDSSHYDSTTVTSRTRLSNSLSGIV
jgi:hypothetical protein